MPDTKQDVLDMLRDLTEHRTLERRQQRERRVAALARLAGGISHQFNNLLAGVLTDATALRADVQREDHAEALDEIAEAAAGIIVVHNHPSGDPTPSADDREVTRQLVEAGRLLDLPVYDHVIVAGERYLSFAEAGLL